MRQPVSGAVGRTPGAATGKYWTISTACAGPAGPRHAITTTIASQATIAFEERADERMGTVPRGRASGWPLKVCVDDLLGAEVDEHTRARGRRLAPHHDQPVSVAAARRLAVDEGEDL